VAHLGLGWELDWVLGLELELVWVGRLVEELDLDWVEELVSGFDLELARAMVVE
jgi:hypothetical protein